MTMPGLSCLWRDALYTTKLQLYFAVPIAMAVLLFVPLWLLRAWVWGKRKARARAEAGEHDTDTVQDRARLQHAESSSWSFLMIW